MLITFTIPFGTIFGEKMYVTGNIPELGDWQHLKEMTYSDEEVWEIEIEINNPVSVIEYHYVLFNSDAIYKNEFGSRKLYPAELKSKVLVKDFWRDVNTPSNPLFKSAFSDVLFKSSDRIVNNKNEHPDLIINLREPRVECCRQIALGGDWTELGEWSEHKVLLFEKTRDSVWTAKISVAEFKETINYKYALNDPKLNQLQKWEQGENRTHELNVSKEYTVVINDEGYRYKYDWRGAGVAVPVFSLRSSKSMGIGEFSDLKLLIDWCKKTGLQMVQLLPVNDTISTRTWEDSYPYNAISVDALNPVYLNLQLLPNFQMDDDLQLVQEKLNNKVVIDFEKVWKTKESVFRDWVKENRKWLYADADINQFLEEQSKWLKPYAIFSVLRDINETADFSQWDEYATFSPQIIDQFFDPTYQYFGKVMSYVVMQYFLDKQLCEATDYGRDNGVVLKGDIPIGISRNSVEAWTKPHLFHMNMQTGAPPDDFAALGQNWGFPTYNWAEMAKTDFSWWRERLQHFARYFDAYRIDHILGFFRIWEIPIEQTEGIMGHFNPALPMSEEEIEAYGIAFNRDRMAKPFIMEFFIKELFANCGSCAKDQYLNEDEEDKYSLKPEFNTQSKIEKHFSRLVNSPDNERLKRGLLALVTEVLFIEDPVQKKMYHPRIGFDRTFSFRALNIKMQEQLWQLYNDYFYYRHSDFWRDEALTKLPSIVSATSMLVCGEDLGMIPASVPEVMDNLGILSLEVQRMPKEFGLELGVPSHYPYWSVASPSSHDTSNIRAFWEERPRLSETLFHHGLKLKGDMPKVATEEIVEAIIEEHLEATSMWTVIPLQDWMALKSCYWFDDPKSEQVNKPEYSRHYWRFRMFGSIETLLKDSELNEKIHWLIEKEHRLVR